MARPFTGIIFLGPPGAGKGTQATLLAKGVSVPHISTGEMMREAVAQESALGKKVKEVLAAGKLVSDDIVVALVEERLAREDCALGYILDGFPRTEVQADWLQDTGNRIGRPVTRALNLVVPAATLIERIVQRATQTGVARTDDSEQVAKKRLEVFTSETAPLIAYYKKLGLLRDVDGVGTIDEVAGRLSAAL